MSWEWGHPGKGRALWEEVPGWLQVWPLTRPGASDKSPTPLMPGPLAGEWGQCLLCSLTVRGEIQVHGGGSLQCGG